MFRVSRNKRIALVLVLSAWTEHATSTPRIAAHINDEEIPTAAVDAMSVDQLDPCGIYFGTTGGQVYGSADGGDTWSAMVHDLPAVLSVDALVIP